MGKTTFSAEALSHIMYWANNNRKVLGRIYALIKDIRSNGPSKGLGKPERLKYEDGWSRRIDDTNRLVYSIAADGTVYVISCKGHYGDK